MKKMKKRVAIALCGVLLCCSAMSGCGKKKEAETTEAAATTVDVVEIPQTEKMDATGELEVTSKDGMYLNPYSGEWIDEKWENKKAVSFSVNNIEACLPQYGIGKADVLFEFVVEGDMTRMLAVFQDYSDIKKVGSIRSARHHFAQMAMYLDTIFIHCGRSIAAAEWFESNPLQHLDLDTVSDSYRDQDRINAGYNIEHTVFTDTDLFTPRFDELGFNTEHESNFERPFKFKAKAEALNSGNSAKKITVDLYTNPVFEYNEEDHKYYRFEYGDKHIDAETGDQLRYENVFVLPANYYLWEDGYLKDVHYWETPPMGYYFSEGEWIPAYWVHEDGKGFHICTEDGKQLVQNPGQTFIEFVKQDTAVTIE